MKSHWQLWGRLYCKQVNTLTALHQLLSAAVHRLHLCLFEWRIVTGTIQTFFKCANLDCETCPTETFWCIVFHCHHYFLFSFLPAMTVSSAANVFTLWVCVCVYVYVCVCVCVCVLETPIVTRKQHWLLCQVFYVLWSVRGRILSTWYHHNRAVVLPGGRYSHETSQVCTPDQNEGQVQKWTWTHPWVLSAYTCPVLLLARQSSVNVFELH